MDNIINVVMNNGLGFASFVLLAYLYMYIMKDLKETNEEILKTLLSMQASLNLMNNRIEKLEERKNNDN